MNTTTRSTSRSTNYNAMIVNTTILAVKGEGVSHSKIRALMRKLTQRQRDCLVLWRGDERHTQQQIADKLGISQQMVATHIRVAIGKLRRLHPAEYTFSPERLDKFDYSGAGVLAVV